jgi:hypothetical protein
MNDTEPSDPPPPENLNLPKSRDPTLAELAPLVGAVNSQINELNGRVIGSDNLMVNKTGINKLKTLARIPEGQPQPMPVHQPTQVIHNPVPSIPPQAAPVPAPAQIPQNVSPVVPVSINYDKKLTAVKRKLSKLDSEMQCIKDVISFDYKSSKYNVETDSFTGMCNNTKTLLNIILKELQSGSKSIIIQKA